MTDPGTRPDPFERRDHYSYKTYANPVTARTFDDLRFGGPIGDLVASTQARVLANMIGRIQDRVVLDVGTGTGRAALILARGGAQVTAVDASEQMLSIARRRAEEQRVAVRFLVGDAHALDFEDRTFDVSVSLRVLMHTPDWARCLAELCRVSSAWSSSTIRRRPASRCWMPWPDASAGGRRSHRSLSGVHNGTLCALLSSRGSASARCIDSSCCRFDCTKRLDRAGSRNSPRTSSTEWDCCGSWARRSRSAPNGACPRNRRNGVHRRPSGTLAREPGRRRPRARPRPRAPPRTRRRRRPADDRRSARCRHLRRRRDGHRGSLPHPGTLSIGCLVARRLPP